MANGRIALGWLALPAVAGLLMASCGSDNKSSSSATSATGTTATSAASAATTGGAATTVGGAATTAASGAAAPGGTKDKITIGLVYGKSGPFADPIKEFLDGILTWGREVNAGGGINGRQIEFKDYDHGETADGGVAACKSILADNDVLFPYMVQGAIAHLPASNCLDQAGMPGIVWAVGDEYIGKWKSIYGLFGPSKTQGEALARFVKARTSPDDKIALAVGSTDIFKLQGDAAQAEMTKLGLNVVDNASIDLSGTTFVPQLQHMKDAGATVVALSTIGVEATMIKEAESIGFAPKWIGNGFGYDYLPAGNPGVYAGVAVLGLSKPTDVPEYKAYQDVWAKYGKIKCQTSCAQQFLGYGYGKVLGAVLQAAGPNPT